MDIHEFLQAAGQYLYLTWQVIKAAFAAAFGAFMGLIYKSLSSVTLPMMPTMMKIFSNARANRIIFYTVAAYIALMNIIAFIMFASDKRRSRRRGKKNMRRISEKALIRVCFFGGALGGLIGMSLFHHKTKHKKFSIGIPALFIIQLVLDSFILGFLGFWAFF